MHNFFSPIWRGLLLATVIGGSAIQALAADVRVGISSKDTYVGMPVVLQIQISNASTVEPPTIPNVDGLEVHSRGTPSRSTHITSINGRTTTTTSQTYIYEIVPERAGSFRIPPITVEADGEKKLTPPIEFVASNSETRELLFVEVAGKEQDIYVGQALDLTLKIWVRPYRDDKLDVTLSPVDMWQMISPRTNWGAFTERIQELAANRQLPAAQEVLRKDRDGVEHSYYLYEIDTTIYPKSPGKIDANDVHVIVEYPTALGRARDPFGAMFDEMQFSGGFGSFFGDDEFRSPFGPRLAVESVRPIVADATVEPINVRPIPTADRPTDYRGAVGHYQIVTEASPATVKAGDPIELLIGIVGTGPMELVQAPPLAELPELTADFKVPNEPLAGFVQDDRKIFSTTIRPRKAGITQIPPIPFTFFDPQQNQFVTKRSRPISIHVDPADTLARDAIVGRQAGANSRTNRDAATESSATALSLANYQGDELLQNESPHQLNGGVLVFLLAFPPLAVFTSWLVRNRNIASRFAGWHGFGVGRVQAQIIEAETSGEVGSILRTYLARRFGVRAASPDDVLVVGALRAAGQHKLAVRCERVFQLAAGGIGRTIALDEVQRAALDVLAEVQTHGQRGHAKPTRWKHTPADFRQSAAGTASKAIKATTLAIVAGAVLFASSVVTAQQPSSELLNPETPVAGISHGYRPDAGASGVALTMEQKVVVLAEANRIYDRATEAAGSDSADAKEAFADAAAKYQLLVDSGVANSRLYVNLANAYLQIGKKGLAIANYRKALWIDPTNRKARANLETVTQTVAANSDAPAADEGKLAAAGFASIAGNWLNRYLGPGVVYGTGIAAWFALWLAIGLRVWSVRFPWKTAAATASVIAVVAAGSYALSVRSHRDDVAIVTSPSVELRSGDGDGFPIVDAGKLQEGDAVQLVKQRGDWLKVRSASGQTGWLPDTTVEATASG